MTNLYMGSITNIIELENNILSKYNLTRSNIFNYDPEPIYNIITPPKYTMYFSNDEIKNIIKLADVKLLPKNIKISTMTVTCKVGTIINLHNIDRFIDRREDCIQHIKYGKPEKSDAAKKKTTKRRQNFYNEATIKLAPASDNKPINIKLFKNGSLQLTGVKNMIDFCDVISKLFFEFKKYKAVIYKGKLVPKPFVKNIDELKLYDIQICMINTSFKIQHNINREILYNSLLMDKISCMFEPCTHACVNIKYQYSPQKKVSIFVFQSGSVIITGANSIDQVIKSYNFIIGKFKKYGSKIISAKIDDLFKCAELKKYL
jgi:TATA-box binding protein (TBP) (component of TFIID and TFIIIB)